ncbi:MAG: hypothetical protein KAT62_03740 [Desulfuromonadales bacterium]|nr:hypothetical protein [Desulfuromonadales bacterium]
MPKIIEKPSKKELSAFTQRGCGLNTIAEHYKCSHRTAGKWVDSYRLKLRRKEPPSKEEIEALFDAGLSQDEAVKELKISQTTLSELIKRHGIKTKAARNQEKLAVAKAKALEIITKKPTSCREIADITGYSVASVTRWLGQMKRDGIIKDCQFTFKWRLTDETNIPGKKKVPAMSAIRHSYAVPQIAAVVEHQMQVRA